MVIFPQLVSSGVSPSWWTRITPSGFEFTLLYQHCITQRLRIMGVMLCWPIFDSWLFNFTMTIWSLYIELLLPPSTFFHSEVHSSLRILKLWSIKHYKPFDKDGILHLRGHFIEDIFEYFIVFMIIFPYYFSYSFQYMWVQVSIILHLEEFQEILLDFLFCFWSIF